MDASLGGSGEPAADPMPPPGAAVPAGEQDLDSSGELLGDYYLTAAQSPVKHGGAQDGEAAALALGQGEGEQGGAPEEDRLGAAISGVLADRRPEPRQVPASARDFLDSFRAAVNSGEVDGGGGGGLGGGGGDTPGLDMHVSYPVSDSASGGGGGGDDD
eukprot:SAG22_NODE_4536_length_1240_cov_1.730061_1_plen_158_part_10